MGAAPLHIDGYSGESRRVGTLTPEATLARAMLVVEAAVALREKWSLIEPRIIDQAQFCYIHGQKWPEGNEHNIAQELEALDIAVAAYRVAQED